MSVSGPLDHTAEVAVIGAGAMGAGIALVAASAGHPVRLYDAAPGACERALVRLAADLERLVQRGKLDAAEAQGRLARIRPATDLAELGGAALVIEAIVENLEVKADVLRRVEALLGPEAVTATNTSSLSVTELAGRLARPERMVGMHFFNPAPVMPLVEVVAGARSDPAVVALVVETAKAWGKVPVRCASTPGFIVNRVARPFYGEALRLIGDGVAQPAVVDAVMRDCGGFRMGPCELMDLIGHDVNFAVTQGVYEGFGQDPRYAPSPVQQALVEAGRLGRKTGQGFFSYAPGEPASAPPDAPPGPRPTSVTLAGALGPAAGLLPLLSTTGIDLVHQSGEGLLRLDALDLALTDGRTAAERSAASGRPTAVFDLALDYSAAPRIALALPPDASPGQAGAACGLFQAMGKAVSLIGDTPGLAVARTVAMLVNEAADGVMQGLASPEDIDLALVKGANYPSGPLAWADRVGAGWVLKVMEALARAYPGGRYRPSQLLSRHAATGERFIPG